MNTVLSILFRCDGSPEIGLGHVVRCLALARELHGGYGCTVSFAVRKDDRACQMVQKRFFSIFRGADFYGTEAGFIDMAIAERRPDILVLDKKYSYDARDICRWREWCRVVIIDNPCPGMTAADFVIFPVANVPDEIVNKHGWGKDGNAVLLHGPEYVIIPQHILAMPAVSLGIESQKLRIVITTGGSDPKGVLLTLLEWLSEFPLKIDVLALAGQALANPMKLEELWPKLPSGIYIEPYKPEKLSTADIGICTFGITVYELMYLGVPVVSIAHSPENAADAALLAERHNCIIDLGFVGSLEKKRFFQTILSLLYKSNQRQTLSLNGKKLIDGKGVRRLAAMILRILK